MIRNILTKSEETPRSRRLLMRGDSLLRIAVTTGSRILSRFAGSFRDDSRRKLLPILVGFLIIVIPVLIFAPRFLTKAQASWYDDNFAYRQTVAVSNAGSAQTNYQIPISLDTATLITAGKMQSDCDDIRVTDYNGKALSLWLETGTNACNTTTTKIWVKVPSVPTPQNVLLLYYGNPGASSVSDGSKVFEFFDDFTTGTSPDSAKWTTTGSPTISSGTAVLTNGAKMVSSTTTTDSSGLGRLIARVKQGATTLTGGKVGFSNTNTLATNFHNDDAITVSVGSTEEQVSQTASTNLVSHHLLEETTSTDANQFKASGYLDTGKLSQAVSVYGNAAQIDNLGSELTFPVGAQISGNNYEHFNSNQGSLSVWVKPSWAGNDGVTHAIFDNATASNIQVKKDGSNNLCLSLVNIGCAVSVSVSGWSANSWHHITARWDADNTLDGTNYLSITIDGSTTYGRTTSFSPSAPNTGHIGFLITSGLHRNYFNGLIDDFAIFDRVLTTTEITNIYNSGTGREAGYVADASLKFYAKMDGSGTLSPVTYNAGATFDNTAYNASTNTNGNMVTNGNFESATSGAPTSWSNVGTPTLEDAETANIGFDTRGQKITSASGDGISQTINVTASTTYTLSWWCKYGTTHAYVTATGNVSGQLLYKDSCGGIDTSIKTGASDTTLTLKLFNNSGGVGSYYFDNVSLTPNLVDNGGMEGTYSSGVAPGWTTLGTPTFSEEGTIIHSGSKSQKFVTAIDNEGIVSNNFNTTAGNNYLVSAWAYATTGSIGIARYAGGFPSGSSIYITPTPSTWTKISLVFKADTGQTTSSFKIYANSGTFYVDDVSVIPLDNTSLSLQSWTPAVDSPGSNSTELATNTGLETAGAGGADVFANWTESAGDGTITQDSTAIHNGTYSAKLTGGATPSGTPYIYNAYTAVGNTLYSYSFWTRGDGTNAGRYGIWDQTNLAWVTGFAQITTGVSGTTYTQVSGTFIAPATSTNIRLYFYTPNLNGGYAYYDDVSIKAVPNPLSIQGDSDGVTSTTSGARGNGYTFDGSTGYLRQKTYDVNIGTLTYADTNTDISDTGQEFEDWDNDDAGSAEYMVVVTNSDNTTSWGYFCANDGGTQTAVYTLKACTGGSEGFNGTSPSGKTPVGYEVRKTDFQLSGAPSNLTLGAWIYPTSVSGNHGIISKWCKTECSSGSYIFYQNGQNLNFYINGGSTPGSASMALPTANTWYFVVMTLDGTSTKLYVNGALAQTVAGSTVLDQPGPLLVGNDYVGAIDNVFAGSIDSPFVTSSALTASQIQDIYNSTASHYGLVSNNAVTNTVNANSSSPTNDTNYATYVLTSGSSSSTMVQGATTIATNTTNLPNSAQYLRLQNADASNALTVDWVAVAKQASTAPTVASPASEEKGGAPVAYWKFDDGTGTNAQDSSPNNNDGTITGATWQTEDMCVSGKCLKYNGTSSDYVTAANESNFDFADTTFTTSGWFKTGATGAGFIVSKQAASNIGGWSVDVNNASAGKVSALIKSSNGSSAAYRSTSTATFNDNKWHYFSVVFTTNTTTGASNDVSIYVDGVLNQGSVTREGVTYSATDQALLFGKRVSGSFFNGFMDDFKIYNYARSAAQVKADYRSRGTAKGVSASLSSRTGSGIQSLDSGSSAGMTNGLVGYWKMDEASWTNDCSTASVLDASGNANNGKACPTTTGPTGGAVGKFGNGGSFDGSDDYVEIPYASNLKLANSGTVSIWFKPTALSSGTHNLISYGGLSYNTGYLVSQSGTTLSLYYRSSNAVASYSNFFSSTGIWYHITFTNDNGTFKVYKNGDFVVPSATPEASAGAITANNTTTIGGISGQWNSSGSIDETRIYNRALSPREVRDLYNWAPGPVGYWNFEEGSGQSANDTSGNGKTGTLGFSSSVSSDDPTWGTGKYGKGLSFDGSNDYINVSDISSTLTINTATPPTFTFGAWFKPTSGGSDLSGISLSSSIQSARLFYRPATTQFCVQMKSATGSVVCTGASSIVEGNWYHVEAVYESATSILYIYLNGVLKSSGAATDANLSTGNNIPYIGYAQNFFKGSIDDVRIYNYARTQKQIVEDMNAGHPSVGSPVGSAVGHWKFDEGYGQTANNSGNAGSSINGTLGVNSGSSTDDPTWSNNGKFGKALSFDGGDYVNTGTNTATDIIANDFSVSTWVQTSQTGTTSVILQRGDHAGITTAKGYILYLGTSGARWSFGVWDGSGTSNAIVADSTTGVNINTWRHLVGVFNASTKTGYLYIDGVLVNSNTKSGFTTPSISANNLVLGASGSNGTNWTGLIDEVKIYNYALTSDEVKTDYNRGSAMTLGTLGSNSSYAGGANNQQYCIPGDSTSCAAPVGEWNFEEGSGSSAYDSSGNGNTGTATGTTVVSGKIGKARSFNGSSDVVTVSNNTSFDLGGGDFTISGWFKIGSNSTNGTRLGFVTRALESGTPSEKKGYLLGRDTNNYIAFLTGDGAGTYNYTYSNGTYLNTDTSWHYFTGVYSSGTKYLYIDGVKQTDSDTVTIANYTGANLLLGKFWTSGSSLWFNGSLDGVKIFNYARTAAQVAWDYNRGAPVARYKFDECQGSTANDASGNSNSGTITIGASGTQTAVGDCSTSATTAWYSGRTGKYNSSLNFDGTDDYVSVNTDPLGTNYTNNTISVWISTSSTAATWKNIFQRANITDGTSIATQIKLLNSSSGRVVVDDYFPSGGAITGNKAVNDGTWHNIVIVRSTTARSIYIDGVLDITESSPETYAGLTPNKIYIGVDIRSGVNSAYFPGQIDDVRIYNYALTSTQIKTLYNENAAIRFGPSSGTP